MLLMRHTLSKDYVWVAIPLKELKQNGTLAHTGNTAEGGSLTNGTRGLVYCWQFQEERVVDATKYVEIFRQVVNWRELRISHRDKYVTPCTWVTLRLRAIRQREKKIKWNFHRKLRAYTFNYFIHNFLTVGKEICSRKNN